MKEINARQRITAQSSPEKKKAIADVLINNEGSFEDTWLQVVEAWDRHTPSIELEQPVAVVLDAGEATVLRAKPRDAEEVARAIVKLSAGKRRLTRSDVMASFGDKAFLLLRYNQEVRALVGWKVENLIARTDDVYVDSRVPFVESLQILLAEVERASKELQCEISLLFLPESLLLSESVHKSLGYSRKSVDKLGARAWQDAAIESMPEGSVMLFKKLREDRVLKPV